MNALSTRVYRYRINSIAVYALLVGPCVLGSAADDRTGEQIFRKRCASCHGTAGEGTDQNYPHPLVGDRSVAQLARFIAKSMPKDEPEKCTGAEAERVAAYVHEAFYSPAAQARNRLPRVELSRLTVRQYQNAMADLVASFRGPSHWDPKPGLQATYYKSFGFRNQNKVVERVDPRVEFDFGVASPDAKLEAHRFSIRWEGSVLAPETGEYEFIVRTEQAARLWVNNNRQPLIDAWVTSGSSTVMEHRSSILLLGGRAYPLRLEFAKGKQGEADGKKKEEQHLPVPATIALLWRLPQRAVEIIPERNLSPARSPEHYVVQTPFPPDDRSVGYERGTTISKAWDRATTDAAVECAAYVVARLADLTGTRDDAPDRANRLKGFGSQWVQRAFRRTLSPELRRLIVDRSFELSKDPESAVKRIVLYTLKSPRFLYREPNTEPSREDCYDVASRISFALWDSLPDSELLKAAAAGNLKTHEQVARQVERMTADLRARSKIREFFFQWLKLDPSPDLTKDPKQFPGFVAAVASDLRTSLDLFLDDIVWSEASDYRQLFLSDSLFLNGRLAGFYGANLPAGANFQKVALNPSERAGVLTHPYLMATFAYTGTSSPIHRGVFLARNVLGQVLRPPPEAFVPLPADLHPDLTTRERVSLQTKPQMCQSCHGMINPLGFTFEHYDAVGRYQEKDHGKPIDATGTYLTRAGERVTFAGVRDLARFLAASEETQDAFIERLFHFLVKQPVRAYGPRRPGELRQFFADHGYNIRKLVVEIVAVNALPVSGDKEP